MTIAPQYFASTDSLIRPGKTKFYPLDIPVPHPQLRHFISTADQDFIYFASSHDIYTLHLPSHRKSLLVTLPFSPRCLVAGLGWICVGGEQNGDAAFLKLIKKEGQREEPPLCRSSSWPAGTKPPGDTRQDDTSLGANPGLVLSELGGDIVNSITLHELSNPGVSSSNEPVALLSNNDKTVKIYSLIQQQLLASLQHPFPVNYAMISPDSEILVSVGDSGQAYFYRRKPITAETPSTHVRFPKYEWKVLGKPRLARGERANDDHSFSITFSPSGHLCAISAQGGVVSVFDMEIVRALADNDAEHYEDAIICSFKSSRPGLCGCIRSMAFSPAPWDLLAWAEDHGRAGVADVRQAFYRRQIIKLDTHAPDIETIIPEDVTDPSTKNRDMRGRLIHQFQENLHTDNPASNGESLLGVPEDLPDEAALHRQRVRRTGVADLDARELSILDTLEVTMEQVDDDAINYVPHPYSVNYRSTHHPRTALENEERSPSRAQLESLIDVFRERNLQRVRGERQYPPRRRNSVVLSQGPSSGTNGASGLIASSTSRSRNTALSARIPDAGSEIDRSRLRPTMATDDRAGGADSPTPANNIPPSDPWHVIQSALDPPTRAPTVSVVSRLILGPSSMGDSDAVNQHAQSDSGPADRSSAHTSTIPTAVSSAQSQTLSRLHSNQNVLRRAIPLSEFDHERQVRPMVSATTDLDQGDGRTRIRPHPDDERHLRILEARILARQRLAAREVEHSSHPSPAVSGILTTQRSDLAGRATVADLRRARQAIMQGARGMMDGNGNWVPGEVLPQFLGRSSAGEANGLGGEAAAREIGVGTAGIGWSIDGRQLYIGTEDGIFECEINMGDRRTFPVLDLR